MDELDFKNCKHCNIVKPTNDFYKNKRLKCGFCTYCIVCTRELAKEAKEKAIAENINKVFVTNKFCKKCNTLKSSDDFYRNYQLKDCLDSKCKECSKLASKQYNRTPEGRKKLYALQKKRYKEGKTKKYYIPVEHKKKTGRKPLIESTTEFKTVQKILQLERKKKEKEIKKTILTLVNDMLHNETDDGINNINSTIQFYKSLQEDI